MSGHRVVNSPATSFYSATKFAVTALTEGLRKELRDIKSNIKITVSELLDESVTSDKFPQSISPGLVATEFGPRLKQKDNPKEAIEEVYGSYGYPVSK